jgi:hypothetical protein
VFKIKKKIDLSNVSDFTWLISEAIEKGLGDGKMDKYEYLMGVFNYDSLNDSDKAEIDSYRKVEE